MADTSLLRAAILVVSDTAAKDPSADRVIPALRKVLATSGKWTISDTKVVPDDVLDIQKAITYWTDREDFINLVVTSGGTGFAQKDTTPEVCIISVE
nr:molybdenum cofactor synthesis protein cinnamon [Quercus suber]